MSSQSSSNQGGQYPLNNLTYDLITMIYEKSKGLEAYDKYMKDAQGDQAIGQILQQIRAQDEQAVQQLQQHLTRLLSQSAQGGASSAANAPNPRSGGA